jgi:hypothetical protein
MRKKPHFWPMATLPLTKGFDNDLRLNLLPSDSESKQVSYRLFVGLPKKIANTIQATAQATTSIRSVMGSVLDHTRPFVVNEPRKGRLRA